jgi:hypothetical protein
VKDGRTLLGHGEWLEHPPSRSRLPLPAPKTAPLTLNALARVGPAGPELEKAVEVTVSAQPVPDPGASTGSNPAAPGRPAHPSHRRY